MKHPAFPCNEIPSKKIWSDQNGYHSKIYTKFGFIKMLCKGLRSKIYNDNNIHKWIVSQIGYLELERRIVSYKEN